MRVTLVASIYRHMDREFRMDMEYNVGYFGVDRRTSTIGQTDGCHYHKQLAILLATHLHLCISIHINNSSKFYFHFAKVILADFSIYIC